MFKDTELLAFYKSVDFNEPLTITALPISLQSTFQEMIVIDNPVIVATILPLIFLFSENPQCNSMIPNYKNGQDRNCYSMYIDYAVDNNIKLKYLYDFYKQLELHKDNQEITDVIKFLDKVIADKRLNYLVFDFMCYE